MATWGGRHVFGNVPRERWSDDELVPFLPLEDLYVEPLGAAMKGQRGMPTDPEPLADLIGPAVGVDRRDDLVADIVVELVLQPHLVLRRALAR
jgi:hypothetical protein